MPPRHARSAVEPVPSTAPNEATSAAPVPDWMDVDAVVAAGIVPSRHAVYRAVRTGDLPEPVVVASRYLWHRPTLERFLLGRATARAEAREAARAVLRQNAGGAGS